MKEQVELKIDKGIPMPVRSSNKSGLSSLIQKMEIGDSIEIPNTMRSTAASTGKYYKIKLATRGAGEDKLRVWRIA